jgi:hypothetical protein
MGPYSIQKHHRNPNAWDVVRNEPTVIAAELKLVEAEALAFALNQQVKQLENVK